MFLLTAITLSLIWSTSIAVAVNMPSLENPTTTATPNTQGQGSLPVLPPVTETKDKQGNTILSSEDKSNKVKTETKIEPVGKEEMDFYRGM